MSVTAEFVDGPATGKRVIPMATLEYIFPVLNDEVVRLDRLTSFAIYRLIRPNPAAADCEHVYKFQGYR